MTLPTNFKVARFDVEKGNEIVRRLEKEIDAARFDAPEGRIQLPVKLRFYVSIFVPLAKWAMLMAGNYRCITEDGMRTAREAVHSDLEASRSIYDFVLDVCVRIGASRDELVPFEKYAAAAESLWRPASAARALNNGAPNIERADPVAYCRGGRDDEALVEIGTVGRDGEGGGHLGFEIGCAERPALGEARRRGRGVRIAFGRAGIGP